jgi:hypothetical protein
MVLRDSLKVLMIKILHTAIWAFYIGILAYMYYLAIINKIDYTFWIAVFLVLLEGMIIIISGWMCPLTKYLKRFVENCEVGFDIFLPKWIAKYNKIGYSILFVLCLILAIYRLVTLNNS